jgi:hypothetical protein
MRMPVKSYSEYLTLVTFNIEYNLSCASQPKLKAKYDDLKKL